MQHRTHAMSSSRLALAAAAAASLSLAGTIPSFAAEPTTAPTAAAAIVDPSTQPQYTVPYRIPRVAEITSTLQHVRDRLDAWASVPTGKQDANPGRNERRQGLIGYPIGVAYAGMVAAYEATGDKAFAEFNAKRFQYIADHLPKYLTTREQDDAAEAKTNAELRTAEQAAAEENGNGGGNGDAPRRGPTTRPRRDAFRNLVSPNSLDACGAINAAFVKSRRANIGPDMKGVIDIAADYVSKKQFRLDDGTLARNRPFNNSLWGDDMYMGPVLLSQMGALTGDRAYFDDAAKNIVQMSERLFVPSTGLFTHAWNAETGDNQPRYYWGRANGWNIMAMAELLSVMPDDHPQRAAVLKLYRAHAQGLATVQSGSGLWHQMLDRPDTYLETSCSAMYTFAIARGVNRGWLDPQAYGPVVIAGWNGLTTKISGDGHLSDVCPGTSYAGDYIYYYHRPAVDDIHGYGPVLMAGSEVIQLLKNNRFRLTVGPNAPLYVIDKSKAPTRE